MIELIRLKSQDDFPENDITNDNATILKQMLADPGIREYAHQTAEKSMTLYRMSHIALRDVLNAKPDLGQEGSVWFNYGIVQYEAAADLLRMTIQNRPRYYEDLVSAQYMSALLEAKDQDNYFDKAHTSLINEQPIFCEVVESVTKQTVGSQSRMVEHALFGVAVQRQVELDAKSNFETTQELSRFLSDGLEL
jgi:hypothetical protein